MELTDTQANAQAVSRYKMTTQLVTQLSMGGVCSTDAWNWGQWKRPAEKLRELGVNLRVKLVDLGSYFQTIL